MSIEKLRQSLERAFGEVSVETLDDERFVASVSGHYKTREGDIAPLVAFGKTNDQALDNLSILVQNGAVERKAKKYPPMVPKMSRVFRDDGARIAYRGGELVVKQPN